MTLEEAIQEFEDFCYHHSLHPEISNEALVIALKAMIAQQEQIIKECRKCSEIIAAGFKAIILCSAFAISAIIVVAFVIMWRNDDEGRR